MKLYNLVKNTGELWKHLKDMNSEVQYLPQDGLKCITMDIFLSFFDYCCKIWGEATGNNIEKLCKLQKKSIQG